MSRIGVFVCECGGNITEKVDVTEVIAEARKMPDVAVAEPYRLLCSPDGKGYLEGRIREERLTHVVIAACSPREHQTTFMKVCGAAGLDPYLMQLVNIREQCAWVTEDPAEATRKAVRLVRAAVNRVRHHAPLGERSIEVNPDVLVLGGGLAGIETSLTLAGTKRKVILVERGPRLGGKVGSFERTFPDMRDVRPELEEKVKAVMEDDRIEVLTECELEQVLGFLGNFEVRLRSKREGQGTRDAKVGAIVVATGSDSFDPSEVRRYGYPEVPGVLTAMEFEGMVRSGRIALENGEPPASVAIVHCVGREELGYCSEVCCMYSLKFARYLSQAIPGVKVTHLYRDMCVPGKEGQPFLEGSLGPGIGLVRATDVRVARGKGAVAISYKDGTGAERETSSDLLILATALVPEAGAKGLAEMLEISVDEAGFFARNHDLLGPVSSTREGVLVIGCSQGPQDIPSTVVQARAAAGVISATLVPGRRMEIEAKTAQIMEAYCQGCGACVSVCPFGAITIDGRRKVAVVNEVICRGCGNCAASCPSSAVTVKHSTYDQIYEEIMEAVR